MSSSLPILRAAALVVLWSGLAGAADKPRIGIFVDGERADAVYGALFAQLANAADILPSEDVHAALNQAHALAPAGQLLDEVAWQKTGLAGPKAVSEALNVDLLIMVRSVARGDRHLTVSVLVVSPKEKGPVMTENWSLKGKGSAAAPSYEFRTVVQAIAAVVTKQASRI